MQQVEDFNKVLSQTIAALMSTHYGKGKCITVQITADIFVEDGKQELIFDGQQSITYTSVPSTGIAAQNPVRKTFQDNRVELYEDVVHDHNIEILDCEDSSEDGYTDKLHKNITNFNIIRQIKAPCYTSADPLQDWIQQAKDSWGTD